MERTKVSPELYRAFEEYFPQVKSLTEEIQESYNKTFDRIELIGRPLSPSLKLIGSIKLTSPFELSGEEEILPTLPTLKFLKTNQKSNPPFYLITSINREILYIGTSERTDDDSILSQSVSAITGGILPITETKQACSLYLGLMCAVKRYGMCYVYEIPTGLEDIKIMDQHSNDITKDVRMVLARVIYKNLLSSHREEYGKLPPLNAGVPLFASIHKIWKCVSAFKTMVENGLVKIEEKEGKQTITLIPVDGGFKISFSNKVRFEKDYSPMSDDFVASHVEQASKLMKNEKFWRNVENAASTLNHDKVSEYFENQYKDYPVPGEDTRVPINRLSHPAKQEEFEKKIRRTFANQNIFIRYANISGVNPTKGINTINDGGKSFIEVHTDVSNPSFIEMQEIIEAVTTAFGIDDGVMQISNEVVESAKQD